jgi:hypothetical protein
MDDRMERRPAWMPWAFASLALFVVAAVAYNIGAHQVPGGSDVLRERGAWGFGHIWGLFFLFWILGMFRWMSWGWWPPVGPWRFRRYYRPLGDDYNEWQEWHRREHQRMDKARGGGESIT